jgi:ABC-2 type transport system permease protein
MFEVAFPAMRRSVVAWAIGLGLLIAATVAFWPAFRGSSGIGEAIDQLPAGVIQAFGLQDFGTPAGFLRGNLYELFVPLLLACAAVGLVNGQTASEEANGRLELFLAQPVERRAIYLARAAAAIVALVAIVVAAALVQLAADAAIGLQIATAPLLATIVLSGLLAFLHGGVAFAVAAARPQPPLVLGIGIGLAVAGYVVAGLFPLNDVLAPWQHVSPWSWAFGGDPLVNGAEPWRYLALAVPGCLAFLSGVILVERRDVAVA